MSALRLAPGPTAPIDRQARAGGRAAAARLRPRRALALRGRELGSRTGRVPRERAPVPCHRALRRRSMTPAMREGLREFLYARLNVDLPGLRMRLPPVSIRQALQPRAPFLRVRPRHDLGAVNLARVDQASARRLCPPPQGGPPPQRRPDCALAGDRHRPLHVPRASPLWRPRVRALDRPLVLQVAGGRQTRENRTPRIPESIITPLLAWSLCYVSIFSADILAARAELDRLEAQRDALLAADAGLGVRERRARQRERLVAFIDHRAGRVVACRSGRTPITASSAAIRAPGW